MAPCPRCGKMFEVRRLEARTENSRCSGCAALWKSKMKRHWLLCMIAQHAARLMMLRMLKLATSSTDEILRSSRKRQKVCGFDMPVYFESSGALSNGILSSTKQEHVQQKLKCGNTEGFSQPNRFLTTQ